LEWDLVIGLFDRLSRPFLRALDPEDAHALTVKALRYVPLAKSPPDAAELRVQAFGLSFPNPVGLAAGFDKNGQVPDALLRLGFGFVEVGTITPRAQSGNPKPRLFRLDADQGVINRLGFNNDGAAAVHSRLAARQNAEGILGVNIGANRDSVDRAEDYVRLVETLRCRKLHRQCFIAEHARPARSTRAKCSTICLLSARCARAKSLPRRRDAGSAQDRA
jgi:dihydroorotate dehydrogenase